MYDVKEADGLKQKKGKNEWRHWSACAEYFIKFKKMWLTIQILKILSNSFSIKPSTKCEFLYEWCFLRSYSTDMPLKIQNHGETSKTSNLFYGKATKNLLIRKFLIKRKQNCVKCWQKKVVCRKEHKSVTSRERFSYKTHDFILLKLTIFIFP